MIPITQYLRPHGATVPTIIDRPDAITTKALAVIAAGGRFTAELLPTDEACLAVEFGDEDHDMEICRNGPAVYAAFDQLATRAHESIVLKGGATHEN